MKAKAYDKITDRILELLEQGTCPWRRPWSRSHLRPQNGQTRHQYSGINLFLLNAMAFESPFFMTFKQVKAKGGNIKKGSTGIPVIYWSTFEKIV
jgi:antirestriction protein ArdC